MPRCPDCGLNGLPSDFFRNRSSRTGFSTYCKRCQTRRVNESAERRHGSHQNYLFKLRYGIEQQTFDALLAAQDGRCAICRAAPARHVDHDHETGRVRGLLCFNCNKGLGYVRDSVKNLFELIDYVDGRDIEDALAAGWRYPGWDLSA